MAHQRCLLCRAHRTDTWSRRTSHPTSSARTFRASLIKFGLRQHHYSTHHRGKSSGRSHTPSHSPIHGRNVTTAPGLTETPSCFPFFCPPQGVNLSSTFSANRTFQPVVAMLPLYLRYVNHGASKHLYTTPAHGCDVVVAHVPLTNHYNTLL